MTASSRDDSRPRVHPTALVEEEVSIGRGTAVWDTAHIRRGARIGANCIIGEKTTIAFDVRIGDNVKINTGVQVCACVEIEDDCMIGAHVVFTNERFPRAFAILPGTVETSAPTERTLRTRVRTGATIGANATIGPGVTIGRFALVGMASAVTRDVPDHALVCGNPARIAGWVCVCGERLGPDEPSHSRVETCSRCGRRIEWDSPGTSPPRCVDPEDGGAS